MIDQKLNEFNERVETELLETLENPLATERSEIEATHEQSENQAQQNNVELANKGVVPGFIDEIPQK